LSVTIEDVFSLVQEKLGGRGVAIELGRHSQFREIGLSSLQIADVVYTLEDRLGIEFNPARAAELATIGDLVDLVAETETEGAVAVERR
jgi:acyl carrier protein